MTGFEVETADMDLLGQVFGRQQAHMQAIGSYVSSSCSASGAFTGVMALLQGHYTPAHQTAVTGYGQGSDIAGACETKIGQTRTQLIASDRRSYELMRAQHPDLPPYQEPPDGGTLAPAGQTVPASSDSPDALEKYLGVLEQGKRPLEAAGKLTDFDPSNPLGLGHGPTEDPITHLSDYTDVSYWAHRGFDKGVDGAIDSYYDHRAANDPSGMSGSDLRDQAALNGQLRYEQARSSGQDFVRNNTSVVDPGHMPNSAWPSDSVREGAHSAAETGGKILNIAGAVPAFTQSMQHLDESVDLHQEVEDAANGPSNTADHDWATSSQGSGW